MLSWIPCSLQFNIFGLFLSENYLRILLMLKFIIRSKCLSLKFDLFMWAVLNFVFESKITVNLFLLTWMKMDSSKGRSRSWFHWTISEIFTSCFLQICWYFMSIITWLLAFFCNYGSSFVTSWPRESFNWFWYILQCEFSG